MTTETLLDIPIEEVEFSVIDFETTGISSYYDKVIEIGLIKVKNGKIIDTYGSFINPGRNIPYFITSLTGISNEDVYDAPFFEDISDEIVNFIDDTVLVAHNLQFDFKFLKTEMNRAGRILPELSTLCTLQLARKLLPQLKSKKLENVCGHYRIENRHAHRAIDDAEATAHVLTCQLDDAKKLYNFNLLSEVLEFQYLPAALINAKDVNKELFNKAIKFPDSPGTYYFLNGHGKVIYIGKAKSLKKRIRSYFSTSANSKAKKIVTQAKDLKFELSNSELTALLNEANNIKEVNPKLNVQLKNYSKKYFLRVNKTKKYPDIEICNNFNFDGNDYFGLFVKRDKAEAIIDILHRAFQLRECKDKEFSKKRPCLLSEIERCTAPCRNEDVDLYEHELTKVYEFLYGNSQTALNRLLQKMSDYSSKLMFEKAAEIKIVVEMILNQVYKTSLLAEPLNKANILIIISQSSNKDYILLLEGRIFIKKNFNNKSEPFDIALEDYFSGTIQMDFLPSEDDLEQMKIILNWIIKNRESIKIYYLKDYTDREHLSLKINS